LFLLYCCVAGLPEIFVSPFLSLKLNCRATAKAESSIAPTDFSTDYYMRVYFAIGLISLGFQVLKAVTLVLGSIVAARRLQAALLSTVLRLPMSFFDSQPTGACLGFYSFFLFPMHFCIFLQRVCQISWSDRFTDERNFIFFNHKEQIALFLSSSLSGRLLNRFTKDTEAVDTSIQSSVSSFLNCAVSVLWAMVVVIAVSPGVALAMVPLAAAYSAVQKRYIATSRELKRLDSLALSPIFSHFSETLQGLATLRAFRVQPWLEHRNLKLLDESNRCFWPAQCVNRWLSVRLELIGISVVFATAVLVSTPVLGGTSAGLAGLALTSALNLTGLMNWMVRQTTELEVNMNSVEVRWMDHLRVSFVATSGCLNQKRA
jgi:ABC-type multidrug transport system fused ATPase/permease subunit